MDGRRIRFIAALVVFVLWVAALAVLAAYSSRRPVARPPVASPL
jgi:hypothetical protein